MTSPAMRERYLADSVTTASPARLLVMLYDRLVLDVTRAEDALRTGDRESAAKQLMHAQDIVIELRTTLDTSAWDGAAGLAQLYAFLLAELIAANVKGDPGKVAECRGLIEPLRDAWREAALTVQPTGSRAA
jgi:flagellar secretion chaperone FliS